MSEVERSLLYCEQHHIPQHRDNPEQPPAIHEALMPRWKQYVAESFPKLQSATTFQQLKGSLTAVLDLKQGAEIPLKASLDGYSTLEGSISGSALQVQDSLVPVTHSQPESCQLPVIQSVSESSHPPVINTRLEAFQPPVTKGQPESCQLPVINSRPEAHQPPVTKGQPESCLPPVINSRPEAHQPPISKSQPEFCLPPVINSPPKTHQQPVIKSQPESSGQQVQRSPLKKGTTLASRKPQIPITLRSEPKPSKQRVTPENRSATPPLKRPRKCCI